jgi:hypothetical protein
LLVHVERCLGENSFPGCRWPGVKVTRHFVLLSKREFDSGPVEAKRQ